MNFYISPIERLILESISKRAKNTLDLIEDTKIEQNIIMNIVQSLLIKNLIVLKQRRYHINQNLNKELIHQLQNEQNMLIEISQIVKLTIKKSLNNKDNSFKYKKVYMSPDEEKLFKALLYQLENFLAGLSNKKGNTYQQKIIFWGNNTYESLASDMLNSY